MNVIKNSWVAILVGLLAGFSLLAGFRVSAAQPDRGEDATVTPYSIYEGMYRLPGGELLDVTASVDGLVLTLEGGDLLQFSDFKDDARVVAVEQKSADFVSAILDGDREAAARLAGDSPGLMSDYIDSSVQLLSSAVAAHPDHDRFEVVTTTYRDEDSAFGFEDDSWGWEVFIRFFGANDDAWVRLVWDGRTGVLQHRGTERLPPVLDQQTFHPRLPARSWIRAYDPETRTIRRLRDAPREHRDAMIPARFLAYNIDHHTSIGIRFRKPDESSPMTLEIGPLGEMVVADRVSGDESGTQP